MRIPEKNRQESATIGFSLATTLYKLRWREGPEEYVRCGADILLNGLHGDLEGEATCPVCKTKTRLAIARGNIDGLEPRDAVLHVVETPLKSGRTWIECESTHIFDKEECLRKWISTHLGKKGRISSVEDYQNELVARKSAKGQPPQSVRFIGGGETIR